MEAIEASRVRDDKCKMEQWGSESDFFKVTGSGVKRGFSGEVLLVFPFWERTGLGGGHRGSEVRIPALRLAIGRAISLPTALVRAFGRHKKIHRV